MRMRCVARHTPSRVIPDPARVEPVRGRLEWRRARWKSRRYERRLSGLPRRSRDPLPPCWKTVVGWVGGKEELREREGTPRAAAHMAAARAHLLVSQRDRRALRCRLPGGKRATKPTYRSAERACGGSTEGPHVTPARSRPHGTQRPHGGCARARPPGPPSRAAHVHGHPTWARALYRSPPKGPGNACG
jgi:hypothetical protein